VHVTSYAIMAYPFLWGEDRAGIGRRVQMVAGKNRSPEWLFLKAEKRKGLRIDRLVESPRAARRQKQRRPGGQSSSVQVADSPNRPEAASCLDTTAVRRDSKAPGVFHVLAVAATPNPRRGGSDRESQSQSRRIVAGRSTSPTV
jgi:hypothetical protein